MKPTRNPWPIAIISAFILFICGTIGLVILACTQRSDLVSADYYEQELKYQAQMDRLSRTGQLATRAAVAYHPAQRRIMISLPPEQVRREVTGRIHLYRPSAAGLDRQLELRPDDRGVQSVDAADLLPGLWKVRVSWTVDRQEYYVDQPVVITAKSS
jgi:hypothetical protein